jgi:uncharacterized protein (TIGR02231 family)
MGASEPEGAAAPGRRTGDRQDTVLDAPITAVTVFDRGARVQRSGTVRLAPGPQQVVVSGLPADVVPASVRVAARGPDVTLLDVGVQRRYRTDPLRPQTAALRADVEACRLALQAIDDEETAEQARLDFLGHLSDSAATALARAVSFGRASRDDLAQMADHLADGTAGSLGRRREIGVRRREARRELEAAESRLSAVERRAAETVAFREVSAVLEAAAATQAEVELSYHVPGASWRPLYDLVLDGDRLAVSYLGEVTQQTGEDWPAVDLVLSTARQSMHLALPALAPWYIQRSRPVDPGLKADRTRLLSASGGDIPEAGEPELAGTGPEAGLGEIAADAVLAAEIGESEWGQFYRIARRLAVPADGEPHKTTIAQLTLDAAVDHLTVPAVAAQAYLRATVTNSSPLMLLPGRARVFHAAQLVGETSMDTVAGGEEFELQLGVDDQVRVKRELRRRATSKAVMGGTRTIDMGFEIRVENHRQGKARVTVHDHIPVSADGDIKVRLREISPSPATQDDLGEFTWELPLDTGESATVRFRFTVEHPAQLAVSGL